jgi:hypothetical protein
VKIIAALSALSAAAVLAAAAHADPANKNAVKVSITCPHASYTGVTIEHNNAVVFQLALDTGVAITQQISYVDGDGNTVVVRTNSGQGHDLVPCTYEYPGFPYLVTGLFQFPGS